MKRMNKKGFTLIELLAVIVILGLLMAIAIPSVTKYITQSRKKTLVSSVNSYIQAVTTDVNNGDYYFADGKIYAVPISCVALEKGGTDPFGKWDGFDTTNWAYVLVQYDGNDSYNYGFTFKDSAGYAMHPTVANNINAKGDDISTSNGSSLSQLVSGSATDYKKDNTSVSWDEFVVVDDNGTTETNDDTPVDVVVLTAKDTISDTDKAELGKSICKKASK